MTGRSHEPRVAFTLALALVTGVSTAWTVSPSVARAWCRMTTDPMPTNPPYECDPVGVPLEWSRRCIAVALNEAGSRDFTMTEAQAIVSVSFGAWLAVQCDGVPTDFDVRMIDERATARTAEYNTRGGNANVVAWVPDWREQGYDARAFALTTVWHNTSTGEIYDADIEMNEQIGTYADCPTPGGCEDGRIDLQNVLTHETGHFFGIAHSDNNISTMWWMADAGDVNKRILRDDDRNALCAIYPPAAAPVACDLTSDVGELGDFTPRGGLSLVAGGDGGGCCSVAVGASRGRAPTVPTVLTLVGLAVVLGRRRRRR